MKHLVNRHSHRKLCDVKHPLLNGDVMVVGQALGYDEPWHERCRKLRTLLAEPNVYANTGPFSKLANERNII